MSESDRLFHVCLPRRMPQRFAATHHPVQTLSSPASTMSIEREYLFTSESVNEGHPDKLADVVS